MKINNLRIDNLRNITHANLSFVSGLNIVTGDNGAGKTSLLESLYLLARAKSFRQGQQNSPIQRGADNFSLFAITEHQDHSTHKIGFQRTAKETLIKLDGQSVKRLSDLARNLPLALVTPQSHRLIEEGPEHRRRILNWGVFHVEHNFANNMKKFTRALLQRNNALKNGIKELSVWDQAFVSNGLIIHQAQVRYAQAWMTKIIQLATQVPFLSRLEVRFHPGWKSGQDLEQAVKDRHTLDRDRGFTSLGPHRADISIRINGAPSRQELSRGQQKILVTLMMLAQARLLQEHGQESPVFLFDDLGSELDDYSVELLCHLLDEQQNQTFVTSLQPNRIIQQRWTQPPKVFHVEHGHFVVPN